MILNRRMSVRKVALSLATRMSCTGEIEAVGRAPTVFVRFARETEPVGYGSLCPSVID